MTSTDTDFAGRFPDMQKATFADNMTDLANYNPAVNQVNTGMLADIARATIYAADMQENFFAKYLRAPLQRGQAYMKARFAEINSVPYDPLAPDSALFNGARPGMINAVAVKNYSRQIRLERNDSWLKQFTQTDDMAGSAEAAIGADIAVCLRDDLWTASKTYFSGSTRSAKATQQYVMTNAITDSKFADEFINAVWDFTQNKFAFKSNQYNAAGYRTLSNSVDVAAVKAIEYPTFKRFYAETFNPEYLKLSQTFSWVDSFADPAGKPTGAGDLLAVIVDPRAWDIVPMPDSFTTEAFRNPARRSTTFFQTTELLFSDAPMFNKAFIYAKGS